MPNYFDTVKSPIYSANFHYFRLAREKWELMLTRLAQMGVGMITVTVPWGFHEFNQGTIDLTGTGNARRNVAGLFNLCAALDIHCLLKPGPYSHHSGILNNGLPLWLEAKNVDTLFAATKSWFQAVSKALVQHQWPNGPIVALQLEYNLEQEQPPTYSQELTEVRWPIWLRKHYQGIDALNQAYGTDYRTVSQVPFPQRWSPTPTPLEADAKQFLEEFEVDTQSNYTQILTTAGWQVPIYLPDSDNVPALQTHSLLGNQAHPIPEPGNALLTLQHAIQIEPDPHDVGRGPVWAPNAPIRADGSLRRRFWQIRQQLWPHILPQTTQAEELLAASLEQGGLATTGQDVPLKISLAKGTKPVAYRLRLTGELIVDDQLKAARARLSGPYLAEDSTAQTDFILYLNDPAAPLNGFLLTYLQTLLNIQAQTINRCAALATELGQLLTPTAPKSSKAAPAPSPKPTSYTLAEARRGLSEADRILRKAMASIGGLEAGFDTILGKGSAGIPEPTPTPAAISPEIFEGAAKDILIEAGKTCQQVAPRLKSAGENLQQTISAPHGLTVVQYQQSYTNAVAAAQSARQLLLEVVARLRVEMASEKLPLVAWRVHNQIQEIVESLRWGVLRG